MDEECRALPDERECRRCARESIGANVLVEHFGGNIECVEGRDLEPAVVINVEDAADDVLYGMPFRIGGVRERKLFVGLVGEPCTVALGAAGVAVVGLAAELLDTDPEAVIDFIVVIRRRLL